MEKLSSGLRINRAGDDAAGLAISEKMRGQIRGLNQASSNAQDGISLIQTAEGALNETHAILQRMRELSVQASSDTNVEADRGEIQKEMNQLTSEINRIGNTTEFNTMKLVNGDRSSESVKTAGTVTPGGITKVEMAQNQTIIVGKEPVTWSGSSKADFDVAIGATANNGFNWESLKTDGQTNELVIERSADGKDFTVTATALEDSTGKKLDIAADLVKFDGATETYSYSNQGIDFSFTSAEVEDWEKSGTFTLDLNAIKPNASPTGPSDATGTHTSVANKTEITESGATVEMSEVKVDQTKIPQGIKEMDVVWTNAASDEGELVVTLTGADGKTTETKLSVKKDQEIKYNDNGISFTFKPASADDAGTLTGNFQFDMENIDVVAPDKVIGAVIEDKSLAFQVGANENQSMSLSIGDMRAAALGLSGAASGGDFTEATNVTDGTDNTEVEFALNVDSHTSAANSVTVINKAIESVSAERSKLGAVQNRLEHTIKNLDTSAENLQGAEARIRDVDMAKEMMEQTKQNILAQASTAMLANANSQPQSVLQLLS